MVKGLTRRVIVIKTPDPLIFEEAIFIVREDAGKKGITGDEIVRQAQEVAGEYIRNNIKKNPLYRIPAPVFFAAGAAATGIAWGLSMVI